MKVSTKAATDGRFHWQPNPGLLLFVAVFLPLTVILGFWQLAREAEKRALLDRQVAIQEQPPVDIKALRSTGDYRYRPVFARGHFDNRRTILLDNRVRHGQPGYEVVSPFILAGSDRLILVNRGWIAGSVDRSVLPDVPAVQGERLLTGSLYRPVAPPFRLGAEEWTGLWPQRLQNLDIDKLAELLGSSVFPWSLRLDATSPAALEVGWPTVNVQPEKHRAYAVQWFSMATALLILAIVANSNIVSLMKKQGRKTDE